MYIISKNFKKHWQNYLWQSVAVGITTGVFLYIFANIIGLIILAGVGSTFFTIFALPNNRTANTRNIIGSYIITILVGISCFYIFSPMISGGMAVGLSTLLMVVTDTEHPPAAGIALGLAMAAGSNVIVRGSIMALISAFVASFLRYILKPWLKDLF
ncbi:MAG: HPP family protein [Halanaerobiales bacterium]